MSTRLRGRPKQKVAIVIDTAENIRALTDQLGDIVVEINGLLESAAVELDYPFLDPPDEAA